MHLQLGGELSSPQRSTRDEYILQVLSELKKAGRRQDLPRGTQVHLEAVRVRCDTDRYVASALINMYSRCRCMYRARAVFDGMVRRDVASWNSLILGYVENGEILLGLDLFVCMDCEPSPVTYVAALKACVSCQREMEEEFCLEKVMALHKQVRMLGFDDNLVVANTLVDMYCKLGRMLHAKASFDCIRSPDICSWTTLILGYVDNGESLRALELFWNVDCQLNCVTFHSGLKACLSLACEKLLDVYFCLELGLLIHKLAKEQGLDGEALISNTLISLYSRCGCMSHARAVFESLKSRDVVSWTNLMLGYVENEQSSVAVELFRRIDCEPDSVTLVAALKACSSLCSRKALDLSFCLKLGVGIHKQAKRLGLVEEVQVANTLLDMYCKSGSMLHAQTVFNGMVCRDVVSWTSLLLGYVENGKSMKALEVFTRMDCQPNIVTYIGALKACGVAGALGVGKRIHADVLRLGLEEVSQAVENSLTDFYGKCSSMTLAELTFNGMHTCDVVSWNSLLAGYSSVGDWSPVVRLVRRMEESGSRMNGITFLLILNACKQAGKVEEAKKMFKRMPSSGIRPGVEHYTCLLDILGRNNRVEDALLVVRDMPFHPDCVLRTTLLDACNNKLSNVELGKLLLMKELGLKHSI